MGIRIENNRIVFEGNPQLELMSLDQKVKEVMQEARLDEYISLLASKLPAPGGGGAAAVTGAQGFALGSMVCNFTIGKPKFAEFEERLIQMKKECMVEAKRMLDLIDLDEINFVPLSKAYGIKAETEEEKAEKAKVMEEALITACLAPLEMLHKAHYGLELMKDLMDKCSVLIISDVGVAAENFRAAAEGAKLNIMINAKMLKNPELKKEMEDYIEEKVSSATGLHKEIMDFVYSKL